MMNKDGHQQSNPNVLERFQPFQMRTRNLEKFNSEAPQSRLNHQKNVMNRAKCATISSSSRSLDILRCTLQECLNQELDAVIQKYFGQYFKPAIENIKRNNGENAVTEFHMTHVFRSILEDAKKMYAGPSEAIKTPTTGNTLIGLVGKRKRDGENNFNIVNSSRKQFTKRLSTSEIEKKKIKQNESREIRKAMLKKRKLNTVGQVARGRPPLNHKSKAVDLGANNLNPDRVTVNTRFVLGSKANKALGFGSARGRLYTKHTDLFRYIGDQEDKQYLHENNLFPISGARAFLVIKDDIEKILSSEEYLNAPGVNGKEINTSFTLPEWILKKIKKDMQKQRVESEKMGKSAGPAAELFDAYPDGSPV